LRGPRIDQRRVAQDRHYLLYVGEIQPKIERKALANQELNIVLRHRGKSRQRRRDSIDPDAQRRNPIRARRVGDGDKPVTGVDVQRRHRRTRQYGISRIGDGARESRLLRLECGGEHKAEHQHRRTQESSRTCSEHSNLVLK
jgi:hypothetical protein